MAVGLHVETRIIDLSTLEFRRELFSKMELLGQRTLLLAPLRCGTGAIESVHEFSDGVVGKLLVAECLSHWQTVLRLAGEARVKGEAA